MAGRAALLLFGFLLVSVFFTAIIGVSVTRYAMTPKPGNIIVYFGFGQAEFNYFLALMAVMALMLAVCIAVVVVASTGVAAVGMVASSLGSAAGSKAVLAAVLAASLLLALAMLVYVGVRLIFLVAPVTVAEGKIDLIRAWQLVRGNFWRALAVVVVTIGPIFIVSQIAFTAIVGPAYVADLVAVFAGQFQAAANGVSPPTQLLQRLPDISSKTPLLLGLGFLLAPFTYGLMFSAPAFAYRALVGGSVRPSAPDVGPFRPA